MPETAPVPTTLADVADAARLLLHHMDRADLEAAALDSDDPDDRDVLADVAYASADACVARADLRALLADLDRGTTDATPNPAPSARRPSVAALLRARTLGTAHEEALHALIGEAAPHRSYVLRRAYAEGAVDAKRARIAARHHEPTA